MSPPAPLVPSVLPAEVLFDEPQPTATSAMATATATMVRPRLVPIRMLPALSLVLVSPGKTAIPTKFIDFVEQTLHNCKSFDEKDRNWSGQLPSARSRPDP